MSGPGMTTWQAIRFLILTLVPIFIVIYPLCVH